MPRFSWLFLLVFGNKLLANDLDASRRAFGSMTVGHFCFRGDRSMKSVFWSISFLTAMMLTAATARSHGVEGYVEKMNGYCITALYDDGEPMSYAAAEIKAPGSETIFQKGRTDRNGRFMILPDGPGMWQAIVQDGMGHRVRVEIDVAGKEQGDQKTEAVYSPAASGRVNRPLKIISGLSIIFGLCGVLYGWKARRIKVGSETNM